MLKEISASYCYHDSMWESSVVIDEYLFLNQRLISAQHCELYQKQAELPVLDRGAWIKWAVIGAPATLIDVPWLKLVTL